MYKEKELNSGKQKLALKTWNLFMDPYKSFSPKA